MKAYRGVEVQLHSFLTVVLDGDEWSTSRRGRLTPKENPGTQWIESCFDPGVSLNGFPEEQILCPSGIRTPDLSSSVNSELYNIFRMWMFYKALTKHFRGGSDVKYENIWLYNAPPGRSANAGILEFETGVLIILLWCSEFFFTPVIGEVRNDWMENVTGNH